jgi:hypothetical protein
MTGMDKDFLRRSGFLLLQGILPLDKASIAPDITPAVLGRPDHREPGALHPQAQAFARSLVTVS